MTDAQKHPLGPRRRPKPKPGGQPGRELGSHRFVIEVDVLCAEDLGTPETLAAALSQCAIAGFYGMLRGVGRVELDGRTYPYVGGDLDIDVRELRPRLDPRIGQAANKVADGLRTLEQALGRRGWPAAADDEPAGTA